MALTLISPVKKTLLTVASTAVTATSANFTIPLADSYSFYLNVTTATAGTCDVVFQTSVDGGTTYVNVPWRFATIATTTGTLCLNVESGLGSGMDNTTPTGNGTLIADTGGALALSAVIDPLFMKVKYTIATGPDAFVLYLIANSRGSVRGID